MKPTSNHSKSAIDHRPSVIIPGFTLIELLVVITIIGVLAGLLLPVLSKAKNRATEAIDMSNLKQMGIATHSHAADNQDRMPWSNWYAGDAPDRSGWLYTLSDNLSIGASVFRVQTGLFWPMLNDSRVYFCPLDDTNSTLFSQRAQKISSYVMNGAVNGYNRADTNSMLLTKLGEMPPSGAMFWETDESHPSFFNDGASFPREGVSKRHLQGAISGAFDGSVAYKRFRDWYQEADGTNKNNLWCYPGSADGH